MWRDERLPERFWNKVEQGSECWTWRAATNGKGYGRFWASADRGLIYAHRWAYERLVEAIPAGLVIDHLCRNRGCVNPAHLEPVTAKENLMRGETITARNAARTHCPRDHEYSEENTYWNTSRGYRTRQCRTCHGYRPANLTSKARDNDNRGAVA